MKKLLITGSSGMLGSNIIREAASNYEIFGIDIRLASPGLKNYFDIDLNNHASVRSVIDFIKPDFTIHCAAITDVDFCEDNYDKARNSNALATKNLVAALGNTSKLIYISTDSVFDGLKGDYSEKDSVFPVNNYAKTKLEGESFVENGMTNYAIIRTNIFGWNMVGGESFIEWIFNSLSQRKTISMFYDVIFSPVSVNTLSYYIFKLMDSSFTGKIHIGSSNFISKYDFGVYFAKGFNMDMSLIRPIAIDEYRFKAKRPKNTSLDVSFAKSIFGSLPCVYEEIKKIVSLKAR